MEDGEQQDSIIQNLGPKISYDNDEISTTFTSKFCK
jgi:hypothetical protein